jgi:hypothetical protein
MHPNEELFRRLLKVWGSGDREGAARFFAEDAVFHYPGPGPLHGEHRGREGILRFWAEQDRLTGGWFRPEFLGLVADDGRVYLLVRFVNADASISFHRTVVYDVEDGAFVAARFFEDDPEAAVAFFSVAHEGSL